MILLDTDHLTLLTIPESAGYAAISSRLASMPDDEVATSIISVEEVMRGWMAVIGRERKVHRQTHAYSRLGSLFDFFSAWVILPFDDRAADEFERLRAARVRIGTMDLKIAAIALVQDATLLTANKRDFEQVPGLKIESWTP